MLNSQKQHGSFPYSTRWDTFQACKIIIGLLIFFTYNHNVSVTPSLCTKIVNWAFKPNWYLFTKTEQNCQCSLVFTKWRLILKEMVKQILLSVEWLASLALSCESYESDGLSQDEDAHDEDHNEEEPHEEAIHDLGDLPPLPNAKLCGSLILVRAGNELNVPAQSLVLTHTQGLHQDLPPVLPCSASPFTSHTFLFLSMLFSFSTGTFGLLWLPFMTSSSSLLVWVVNGHK